MKLGVIGGGIQGICVALEFARHGAAVELIERRPSLMLGASRENEGKIHLGYVYANDATFATARLMAHAAVRFAPLLAELGCDVGGPPDVSGDVSQPFIYAVHRDSLVGPDELERRYAAISALVNLAARQGDYFGIREPGRMRRLGAAETARLYDPTRIAAAFESAEIAVDPMSIADRLVRRVMAEPRIRVRTGVAVSTARPRSRDVALTFADGAVEAFDHVVNCGWCGRLAIDATAGILPMTSWSFRRKYFLRLPTDAATGPLPTTTVVLGGFGDVVNYPGGDTFLSWYPASCRGIETSLTPREESLSTEEARSIRAGIVRGLGDILPAARELSADTVAAARLGDGIIFALGATDVDDPASRLHTRRHVGPRSLGRYHTIDTGKYTTAPLFARMIAESMLLQRKAA